MLFFFHKVRQKKKIKPRASTILFFTCTQHSSEIQLFTLVDLTEVFEHWQYAVLFVCFPDNRREAAFIRDDEAQAQTPKKEEEEGSQ